MGDLKHFDLGRIAYLGNCKFFVETGTFEGDTTQHVYDNTSYDDLGKNRVDLVKFWTIECDASYAVKARERFKDCPNIEVVHEDSITGLEYVDSKCNGNTIFWLDAHFVGSDGGHNSYDRDKDVKSRLPLEWELKILEQRLLSYRDVIIIDDVRIYEDGPFECGTFDDAMRSMNSSVRRSQISPYNSIDPLLKPFAQTHNVYKLYKHQGYAVLLPKRAFIGIDEVLWS